MNILFLYELGGTYEADSLRQAGHSVDLVSTAKWAYEELSKKKYQAIIIHGSNNMPVKDERCLSKLVQDEFPETIRICYMGEVTQHYMDQFMERFDAVASKLLGVRDLQAIIEKIQK